jgi:hypothetical protein
MNQHPTFSILHTSARPGQWRAVYDAWLRAADDQNAFEYILVIDPRWGFPEPGAREFQNMRPQDRVVVNDGRRCYVDGVNTAAKNSAGSILIVNADDQFPAPHWDTVLKSAVNGLAVAPSEFVLWANTGTPSEVERGIVVMPIVSRARYDRLGYLFYWQYESMYADNDLCAHAKKDGCLFQLPAEFVFPHRHPFFSNTPMDDAYQEQNRQEAYALGVELFKRRQQAAFGEVPPVDVAQLGPTPARKHLAVCLAGRYWPLEFMVQWSDMVARVIQLMNFTPIFGSASDPSVVRAMLAGRVQNDLQLPADFVLWIDSDNVLPFPYLLEMLKTLDARPEITAVTAWCWLLHPAGRLSCGSLDDKGHIVPLEYTAMMAAPEDLQEVEYTGFPAILMRKEMIDMAGPNPFCPIVADHFSFGKSGEDYAFCVKARAGGARIFVDRRLKVDHLKLGTLDCEAQAKALDAAGKADPQRAHAANSAQAEQIPVPVGEQT